MKVTTRHFLLMTVFLTTLSTLSHADATQPTQVAAVAATSPALPAPKPLQLTPFPGLVLTQEVIDSAIRRGKEMALKGKTGQDLNAHYTDNPFWVRGHGGRAHESWVCAYGFDGQSIATAAFDSQRLYKPLIMPSDTAPGTVVQNLPFRVFLQSIPKVKQNFWTAMATGLTGVPYSKISDAERADTEVDGFVLSDDRGNNIQATNATEKSAGAENVTLLTAAPDFSGGTIYTNRGSSSWTTTSYSYVEKNRPCYTARYDVSFGLYDASGKPLLDPNARKLTLRIITHTGEMDVEYPLPYRS